MSNKTCKNCKHYLAAMFHCQKNDVMAEAHNTCEDFERKAPPSNGDKIRQGENRALAEFQQQCSCDVCVYFGKGNPFHAFCDKPDDKTCIDGIEAWLNAPAAKSDKSNKSERQRLAFRDVEIERLAHKLYGDDSVLSGHWKD